jgi:recombinational DNA repair protein RecR
VKTEETREKLRLAIEADKAKGKLRPAKKELRCCESCGRETRSPVCGLCLYGARDDRFKRISKDVEGDDANHNDIGECDE